MHSYSPARTRKVSCQMPVSPFEPISLLNFTQYGQWDWSQLREYAVRWANDRQYCTLVVRLRGCHPRKPLSGLAAASASIFGMVEKNQRYLGSFHQRLNRAPMMKTTKSPSIEAAMRRLMVAIGDSLAQGSEPA